MNACPSTVPSGDGSRHFKISFISNFGAGIGRAVERKDEDFICFYRDAVIAGPDYPAAEAMCRFNLSHDLIVRVLNETVSGWEGQDIRSWKK
jgi:hypothetical protein